MNSLLDAPFGGLAAALLVGVRDYIDESTYALFRDSGLAHLLAISGLHMGLFCFSVFSVLRVFFGLFPSVSQHIAVHKLAALCSLLAGGIYLILAGFPISAIRAYLMAVVIIIAVLADRRALSLRNLALVGFILLLFQPSIVYMVGFQLSFIASFAIISMACFYYCQLNSSDNFDNGFYCLSFWSIYALGDCR